MAPFGGALRSVVAVLGLFFGGAAIGLGLAGALAPGSGVATVVSFFALPIAFAAGLQTWYGLALLSLLPRLLRWGRGAGPRPVLSGEEATSGLSGAWVFLPFSSAGAVVAGGVVGLVSTTQAAWFTVLVYWLVGTLHGLLAWRLARGGILLPLESA
jgi:hypothetical protein